MDLRREPETSTIGGPMLHGCAFCDTFTVEEPPPTFTTKWGDDGSIRIQISRYGWELPVIQHIYMDHPDQYALLFGTRLLTEALLQTAQRAEQTLNATVNRMLTGMLPGR